MIKQIAWIPSFLLTCTTLSYAKVDTSEFFGRNIPESDSCFIMTNLETKITVAGHNFKRCTERLPPMSTFKIPIATMAFDSGYLKSADQKIQWDGKKRSRKSLNQDQTAKTFIKNSVIWVSRLIVNHLGKKKTQGYLNKFQYGNKLLSGDINNFWLSDGSVKISANEQLDFLSRLWKYQLPISRKAVDLTKEAIFAKEIAASKIYGKTGTGCIDSWCMDKAGRQLGWFVGVLENKSGTFIFALNSSSKKPMRGYAGPNVRKAFYKFVTEHHEAFVLAKSGNKKSEKI